MKRKIIIAVATVFLSGFVVISLLRGNTEYYEKYEDYKYGFIPYYSTIESKASDSDKAMAKSIVGLACEIMTDTQNGIHPNAGKLEAYSVKYSLTERETVRVEADMNLITADFTFSSGYIWVEYRKTTYDSSDEIIDEASYLAHWKLKKQDGIWTVTGIKEEKVNFTI